jgi:hypothetical protein
MDIETVIRESQVETLSDKLNFQTETGKRQFVKQLRFFTAKKEAIQRRQQPINALQADLNEEKIAHLDRLFQRVSQLESKWKLFTSKSDVEKNSYEQLTFSGWAWAQILNTIPYVLLALSYFKLYVVPFLAILTPVFMFLMPYIILIHFYKLPLSFMQYKDLLLGMMGIQSQDFWTPKNIVQVGITGFSIVQNIVQPVQNAIHLQTIDKDLIERGTCIEELATILKEIHSYIPVDNPLEEIAERPSDPHRSFAETWDIPFRFQLALQLLGDAEVIYRLAISPVRPVLFSSEPSISFLNAYDPLLKESVPFNFQADLSNQHHTLLTGPNRGGKSSFLRAMLLNIVLAQTFGFTYSDVCLLKPVDWIATGLRLEDRPGKSSFFEREVEFATSVVKRAQKYPNQIGLVLFDELFHSTNPPDGTRTAKLFLERLWKQANVYSIISTHVFEIARNAPKEILRLCVPAHKKETGEIEFTYRLQRGICEISSVDSILKEKGLLTSADFNAPENRQEKER